MLSHACVVHQSTTESATTWCTGSPVLAGLMACTTCVDWYCLPCPLSLSSLLRGERSSVIDNVVECVLSDALGIRPGQDSKQSLEVSTLESHLHPYTW